MEESEKKRIRFIISIILVIIVLGYMIYGLLYQAVIFHGLGHNNDYSVYVLHITTYSLPLILAGLIGFIAPLSTHKSFAKIISIILGIEYILTSIIAIIRGYSPDTYGIILLAFVIGGPILSILHYNAILYLSGKIKEFYQKKKNSSAKSQESETKIKNELENQNLDLNRFSLAFFLIFAILVCTPILMYMCMLVLNGYDDATIQDFLFYSLLYLIPIIIGLIIGFIAPFRTHKIFTIILTIILGIAFITNASITIAFNFDSDQLIPYVSFLVIGTILSFIDFYTFIFLGRSNREFNSEKKKQTNPH